MKRFIAFFEIPCADFDRAVRFYEVAFNLRLNQVDCKTEKMAFFPEEEGVCPGAISFAPDFNPSHEGVLISLTVENMEETVERIQSAGGKMLIEKTKIEADGMGYFSNFIDSEGNRMGLYSDN